MTPSLKIKRKLVLERFAEKVDELYADEDLMTTGSYLR